MPVMVTSGDPFRSSEPELLADMMATSVVRLPNVVTVKTVDLKGTDHTGENMRGVHGTSRYARVRSRSSKGTWRSTTVQVRTTKRGKIAYRMHSLLLNYPLIFCGPQGESQLQTVDWRDRH